MTIPIFQSIGIIHSPYTEQKGTPIQPTATAGQGEGRVEVLPEFEEGLKDLEGFERIWLFYLFDRAKTPKLTVTPYMDTEPHGPFATRAPSRPNPLGISCVRLLSREGCSLKVREIDILNETPLLDIKPYVPQFDAFPDVRAGWTEKSRPDGWKADSRFSE